MINSLECRNELASKFNKLTDMKIEYFWEKANDLNDTIPLELNKLKEKTTDVDKIYKILDEFNAKLDYIQFEQKMNLLQGSTDINNIKEEKLIQLDKKKEQLAVEQIRKVNELIENINELEVNIKELAKYNEETKPNQLRQWQIISKIDSGNSKQMVLYVQRKRNII